MLAQGQQWNLALQDIQLSVEAGYPKGKVKIHKILIIVNRDSFSTPFCRITIFEFYKFYFLQTLPTSCTNVEQNASQVSTHILTNLPLAFTTIHWLMDSRQRRRHELQRGVRAARQGLQLSGHDLAAQ